MFANELVCVERVRRSVIVVFQRLAAHSTKSYPPPPAGRRGRGYSDEQFRPYTRMCVCNNFAGPYNLHPKRAGSFSTLSNSVDLLCREVHPGSTFIDTR